MHRNLLFDLDQTLLDFHASERIALRAVMDRYGLVFTDERYAFFKDVNKNLWLEFEKGSITKTELFETRFGRLFTECGLDTSGMNLLDVNSFFIDYMSQHGVLLDGVLEFLQRIADNIPDARSYVITNGVERNALGRINSTGLNKFIREVFVSETIGASKPSTEYFEFVRKAVGEPDGSCIVIGDSLTSDMLGAKNAGLTSCWFMPDENAGEAVREFGINYTASSFDELYEVIRKWSGSFKYT